MRKFLIGFSPGLFAIVLGMASSAIAQTSQWVFVGPDGKLQYKILPNVNNPSTTNGDHIMDFSSAGYMGGGVSLPNLPVLRNVSPSGADDTSAIQAAINAVAALTPDANGFRGAVLLAPGVFNISSTLNINAGGVVLRGSGSGGGGTIINMTGSAGFRAIDIRGSGSYSTSNSADITNSYAPSGTNTVSVSSASGFSVGDNVLISRPVTADWIHFMGMDTLVRNGQPQTWLTAGSAIITDRAIKAISGNTITLDAPLTDSFDSVFLGTPVGSVARYTFAGRISQVGVEHLKIQAPIGTTVYGAIQMDNIIDSWIQDVVGQETQNAFNVNKNAKRITLDRVIDNITTTQTRSAGTADFSVTGTQVLLNQCQSNGTGDWPFVTSTTGTGPIVVLNFSTTQSAGYSPHQRWTTGILVDSSTAPNAPSQTPGVAYRDRGTAGSGQGWTSGWSVAWNVNTPFLLVQQPPGSENWCIGCVGTEVSASRPGGDGTLLPNGIFDSLGAPVTPSSLYLAQLCERLGPSALTNIGYDSSSCVDFSLSATPGSRTVTAGGDTSYTATVAPSQGFHSAVNLSVSGLPSGTTASFNPASISDGAGSSTLTVSTSGATPAGTYTLTISGASGSFSHSDVATLVVNSSATLPPGWSDTDVGATGVAGSATFSGGAFTVNGSGADIWSSSDSFNYVFQSSTGNTIITARVASQENTNLWAKSGAMIRETTAANSSYVFVFVTPGHGVNMQYRSSTGAGAAQLAQVAGPVAPYWVRLTRSGNTFTGFASADGVSWTQVGAINVIMASNALQGLAVTAHNNSTLNTSTFDNVSVNKPVTVSFEAEASGNTLAGAARVASCSACSGGQKVGFIGNGSANFVSINDVNAPVDGDYQMQIDYLVNGTRSFSISINGGPALQLSLSGASFSIPASATITVPLRAGSNTIRFGNDAAFAPDLDRIVISGP